jgi:hypothetical protein
LRTATGDEESAVNLNLTLSLGAYTVLTVTGKYQRSRLSACIRFFTALTLLLLLTTFMVSSHHVPGLICFILVPLFLFAAPVTRERATFLVSATLRLAEPVRTALFQRPPPSLT